MINTVVVDIFILKNVLFIFIREIMNPINVRRLLFNNWGHFISLLCHLTMEDSKSYYSVRFNSIT